MDRGGPLIRKSLTDESIKNLRRLQGEFRPSELQVGLLRLWSTVIVISGVFLVWICFLRMQRLPPSYSMVSREGTRLITPGLYGLVALLFGPGLWRKAGRWYRFGSGQVQMLSRSGAVLWTEDVLGIVGGTISYDDRNNAFMSLRWANAKRRVDIYPSLAEALKALEPPAVPASGGHRFTSGCRIRRCRAGRAILEVQVL